MKVAYLFPGQGAQYVGMCKDLYEKYDEVKSVYDDVKRITGIDIAEISFTDENSILNETKNTQLAVLTMSMAILNLLQKYTDVKADVTAGLSLGEYSALVASKALSFADGVKTVHQRGICMQELLPQGDWLMAAIIGLTDDIVEGICNDVSTSGFVKTANYNTVSQVVISGEKTAVEQACILAKERGARMANPIKTAGPFHTEKMLASANAFRKEIDNLSFNEFEFDVIKNINAEVYSADDDIKNVLEKHIVSPVKFSNSLQSMIDMGVDTFVEIGPGKILSGFVKRMKTEKPVNILNISDVKTFEQAIEFFYK